MENQPQINVTNITEEFDVTIDQILEEYGDRVEVRDGELFVWSDITAGGMRGWAAGKANDNRVKKMLMKNADQPITGRQVDYLMRLLDNREIGDAPYGGPTTLDEVEALSRGEASEWIDHLKARHW